MSDPIVKAAKAEEAKLLAELETTPTFRRLTAVRALIAAYGGASVERYVPKNPVPPSTPPKERGASERILVRNAAAEFLRKHGARASSGEIAKALLNQGVSIGGKKKTNRVASYLSGADAFDNVKGEGYGLKEWAGQPAQQGGE